MQLLDYNTRETKSNYIVWKEPQQAKQAKKAIWEIILHLCGAIDILFTAANLSLTTMQIYSRSRLYWQRAQQSPALQKKYRCGFAAGTQLHQR